MSRWTLVAGLLTLGILLGCGRESRSPGSSLTREGFIQANVSLRAIPRAAPAADSMRQLILEEHGTSEEDLNAYVHALADRPEELAAVWNEIHERLAAMGLDLETDEEGEAGEAPASGMLRAPSTGRRPVAPDTVAPAPDAGPVREPAGMGRTRPRLRAT